MARLMSAFRLGRVIGRGLVGPVSGRIARYAVRRAIGNYQWVKPKPKENKRGA